MTQCIKFTTKKNPQEYAKFEGKKEKKDQFVDKIIMRKASKRKKEQDTYLL